LRERRVVRVLTVHTHFASQWFKGAFEILADFDKLCSITADHPGQTIQCTVGMVFSG
jgi:hypothetical protein